MFNFGNIFSPLLSGPVGNGMPGEADDVKRTRRHFASIGRYDGDTELGYIDRKLDDTIRGFQRDEGLKIDGVMKPGGETERALHRTLEKKKSGLFGSGFGERPKEREDNPLTLSLVDSVGNNKTNRPDDVKQVQRGLSRIGMAPRSRLFEPSGIIDTETTDAVKTLQEKQSLKVDGYLNPRGETERTINTLLSSVKTEEGNQTSGAEDAKPDPEEAPEKPKETPKPDEKKKEEKERRDDTEQICINIKKSLKRAYDKRSEIMDKISSAKNRIKVKEQQIKQAKNEMRDTARGISGPTTGLPANRMTALLEGFSTGGNAIGTQEIYRKHQNVEKLKVEIQKLEEKIKQLNVDFDKMQKRIMELEQEVSLRCPTDG